MEKKRQGFALVEMIAVMALILILGTIAVVRVARYQKPLELIEMDETAKEIFLSARDRLDAARTQSTFDGPTYDNDLVVALLGRTTEIPDPDDNYSDYSLYYGIRVDGDGHEYERLATKESGVADLVLPKGSVERSEGNYVIHYDRRTYQVLDVFYVSDASFDLAGYIASKATDGTAFDAFIQEIKEKGNRMEVTSGASEAVVGWYGLSDPDRDVVGRPEASDEYVYLYIKLDGGKYDGVEISFDRIDMPRSDKDKTVRSYFEAALNEKVGESFDETKLTKTDRVFFGWESTVDMDKTIGDLKNVTAVTIQAKWTGSKCTITFVNSDGTVLQSEELSPSDWPVYKGAVPTWPSTAQYTYMFAGWDHPIERVSRDFTYTATYTATVNKYTITWKNENGTELEKDEDVEYGTTPTYDGATPTKAGNAQYSYTFAGWTPEVTEVTGNATYTATYTETVNTYTITWKNDDGTELEKDEDVAYGATPSYDSATPTKAADAQYTYAFDKWSPDVSSVADDATYTATYTATPVPYTITYELGTGAALPDGKRNPESYDVTSDGITLYVPERTGYTFADWTRKGAPSDPAAGNKVAKDAVAVPTGTTGDLTFTANWTTDEYDITYVLDGGTNASANPPKYTVEDRVTLADPSKTGYTFSGWYEASDFSGTAVTEFGPGATGNKTFYAQWTANTYTVEFKPGEGTGEMADQTFTYGVAQALTANTFTRTGYEFAGWKGQDGKSYADKESVSDLLTSGVFTMTAQWNAIEYTIKYELNGVGVNHKDNVYEYTVEKKVTLHDPTGNGYTFEGWYEASDFSGTAVTEFGPGATGDKTFYAKWTEITYKITYHLDGGTNDSANPETYTVKSTVTLKDPTKTGYTFGGWYTDAKLEDPAVTTFGPDATGDRVFYAKWTANTYKVVFEPGEGGTGTMDPQTFTYGVAQALTANAFTRTGYKFDGWKDNDSNKTYTDGQSVKDLTDVPNGTVTLTAQWKVAAQPKKAELIEKTASDTTYTSAAADDLLGVVTLDGLTSADTDVTVLLEGLTSKNKKILHLSTTKAWDDGDIHSEIIGEGDAKQLYFVVDSISAADQHFAQLFGGTDDDALIPGEQIKIWASLGTLDATAFTEAASLFTDAHTDTHNSLFSETDAISGGGLNANIKTLRHLENLDQAVSGVESGTSLTTMTATLQGGTLAWDGRDVTAQDGTSATKGAFYGISNPMLTALTGNDTILSDFVFKGTYDDPNAGFFREVSNSGLTVRHLWFKDAQAEGLNAGVLAAEVTGGLTVETVLASGSKTVTGTVTKGTTAAGGLIGLVKGSETAQATVTLTNTASSMLVDSKNYAGGLIGHQDESSTVTIEKSYVGGHTDGSGKYVDTYAENIHAQYAGGLIGCAEGTSLTVTQSFSTASVCGDGFVGGIMGANDKGTTTIREVYTVAPAAGADNGSKSDYYYAYAGGTEAISSITEGYYVPLVYNAYDASKAEEEGTSYDNPIRVLQQTVSGVLEAFFNKISGISALSDTSYQDLQIRTITYDSSLKEKEFPFKIWTRLPYDGTNVVTEGVYFFGDWEPIQASATSKYAVKFTYTTDKTLDMDEDGELVTVPYTEEDGLTVIPAAMPFKDGYKFKEWRILNSDGAVEPYTTLRDDPNVSQYARLKVDAKTVAGAKTEKVDGATVITIDALCETGGKVSVRYMAALDKTKFPESGAYPTDEGAYSQILMQQVELGETKYSKLYQPKPNLAGYEFLGWYTGTTFDDAHEVTFDDAHTVDGALTLYAGFRKIEYFDVTVTYRYVTGVDEETEEAIYETYRTETLRGQVGETLTENVPLLETDAKIVGVTKDGDPVDTPTGKTLAVSETGAAEYIVTYEEEPLVDSYYKIMQVLHTVEDAAGTPTAYRGDADARYTGDEMSRLDPAPIDGYKIPGGADIVYDMSGKSGTKEDPYVVTFHYHRDSFWLDFDAAGGSPITAKRYVYGQAIGTLSGTSVRDGYTFAGWKQWKQKGAPDSDLVDIPSDATMPARDMTAKASWTGKKVGYTVVFWKQSVNDDVYATDAAKTYDYAGMVTGRTGDVGTTAQLQSGDKGYSDKSATLNGKTVDFTGFTYNDVRSDIAGKTIAADGSMTLNVYYDRNVHTINFYTQGNGDYYTVTTDTNGQQYGLIGGEYVPLTPRTEASSYKYTPLSDSDHTTSPQYGHVDGEYVQLTRVADTTYTYSFQYTYSRAYAQDYTDGSQQSLYYLNSGSYTSIQLYSHNRKWYQDRSWRGGMFLGSWSYTNEYKSAVYTRTDGGLAYTGDRYVKNGTNYTRTSNATGTLYGWDGKGYVPLTFASNITYTWTYNGETYGGTRFKREEVQGATIWEYTRDGETYTYSGTRYLKNTGATGNWRLRYSITALYGQRIGNYFSEGTAPLGTTYKGYTWDDRDTTKVYSYILKSLEMMPNTNVEFRGSDGNTTKTIYYYVEVSPGETGTRKFGDRSYKLQKTIKHSFRFLTYEEEYHPIDGFSRDKNNAEPTFGSSNQTPTGYTTYYLYYTRNSYALTFWDTAANVEKTAYAKSVPYEAAISGYLPATDPTTTKTGGTYTWDGKYYEDQACTQELDPSKKMPSFPVVVYLKFKLPDHTVTFNVEEGVTYGAETDTRTFTVEENTNIGATIANADGSLKAAFTPVRAGYRFDGWEYTDSKGVKRDFYSSMPITEDITLYPKWTDTSVKTASVLVKCFIKVGDVKTYLKDSDGFTEYMAEYEGWKIDGEAVVDQPYAVIPPTIKDYRYKPDTRSLYVQSSPDFSKNENVIELEYVQDGEWTYTTRWYVRLENLVSLTKDTWMTADMKSGLATEGYQDVLVAEKSDTTQAQYETVVASVPEGYENYRLIGSSVNGAAAEEVPADLSVVIHPDDQTRTATVSFYMEPDTSRIALDSEYDTYNGQSWMHALTGYKDLSAKDFTYEVHWQYWDLSTETQATQIDEPTNAGVYAETSYITATVGEGDSARTFLIWASEDWTTSGTYLFVSPRPIVATSVTRTWTYDGEVHTAPEITFTYDGDSSQPAFVGDDKASGTEDFAVDAFRRTKGTTKNVFDVKWLGDTDPNNYAVTKVYGTLTVN